MDDSYTYIRDLLGEVAVPPDGILSRILDKDAQVNITLFGFDTGQELSEHTASAPAIIQILRGEAALTIASEEREGGAGTWIQVPARTPQQPPRADAGRHALAAVEGTGRKLRRGRERGRGRPLITVTRGYAAWDPHEGAVSGGGPLAAGDDACRPASGNLANTSGHGAWLNGRQDYCG